MIEPTIVFRLIDRRQMHAPSPVQGRSNRTYATARFEEKYNAHVFRLTLTQALAHGLDLTQGQSRPLCGFYPVDVELPPELQPARVAELEAENARLREIVDALPDELDRMNFRALYNVAKDEGVPKYSYIQKPDAMREAIRAHRAHREETTPPEDSGGHPALDPALATAPA